MSNIVAIVGRPNVGKSTLFNRLSTDVKSLTFDVSGVTRDFLSDTVSWQGRNFELIDTAGLSFRKTTDPIASRMREQAISLFFCGSGNRRREKGWRRTKFQSFRFRLSGFKLKVRRIPHFERYTLELNPQRN